MRLSTNVSVRLVFQNSTLDTWIVLAARSATTGTFVPTTLVRAVHASTQTMVMLESVIRGLRAHKVLDSVFPVWNAAVEEF